MDVPSIACVGTAGAVYKCVGKQKIVEVEKLFSPTEARKYTRPALRSAPTREGRLYWIRKKVIGRKKSISTH
jgi:hypothetical protein